MASLSSERLHATGVAIDGRAVLIEGPSGTGKSDLALRLIDRGATLISDDYTLVTRDGERLIASAPATIAGKIEVRGLGIVDMPFAAAVPVALIVSLGVDVARMPLDEESRAILDVAVPVVPLVGHEASAPIKVELALRRHAITSAE